MRIRSPWHIVWALALLGAVTAASAQPQPDAEAQAEAAREMARAREEMIQQQAQAVREMQRAQEEAVRSQAEAMREMQRAQAELARQNAEAERQMAQARTQLEQAARDLARLSAGGRGGVAEAMRGLNLYAGRATLGINLDPESTELGVRVVGVTPNGPAANAGVLAGDVIVAVDGTDLTGLGPPTPAQRLVEHTRELNPGATIELRVLRDGDYRDLDVVTRERDLFVRLPQTPNVTMVPFPGTAGLPQLRTLNPRGSFSTFIYGRGWGDLELVPLTPGLGAYFGVDKGLLVVRAAENTMLGFRDGDVILDIGGREPSSPEHAYRILQGFEPGETIRVSIMRERRRETLEAQVPTAETYTEWFGPRGGV